MTNTEIISGFTIHLILPLTGLIWFLQLKKKMKRENITAAPITDLFIIFSTYGGLLLVVLTSFFWQWSGMASLGTMYLMVAAPIIMGVIAFRNKQLRTVSKYHNWTYLSGLLYYVIAPTTFGILLSIGKY